MGVEKILREWDRDGFSHGARNLITDVPGVRVGHATLRRDAIEGYPPVMTGVTAIFPHGGNLFQDKPVAAVHIINGFGKSAGTLQVRELGTIETPILLTNTLSVGDASAALVRYMLESDAGITSVNPLVFECNDGLLSDIRGLHVREEDVRRALACAAADFEEGDVGAGTGMVCYQLKGGVGSASRLLELDGFLYTVGCLALTNFGAKRDLVVQHRPVGRILPDGADPSEDKGSVIVILATDLPLSSRQLGRVCRRVPVGIGRTGSFIGNQSGEIALAFTTANRMSACGEGSFAACTALREDLLDRLFRLTANLAEEAIISSMLHAGPVVGAGGRRVDSLRAHIGLLE